MTQSLERILEVVEGHEQTLTFYNVTVPPETISPIRSYFDVTTVSLRQNQTSEVHPNNFVVLHEEENFIAACGIEELRRAVDPTGPMMDTESRYMDRPDLCLYGIVNLAWYSKIYPDYYESYQFRKIF